MKFRERNFFKDARSPIGEKINAFFGLRHHDKNIWQTVFVRIVNNGADGAGSFEKEVFLIFAAAQIFKPGEASQIIAEG